MDESLNDDVEDYQKGSEENSNKNTSNADSFKKPLLLVGPQRGKLKGPKHIHPVIAKETNTTDDTGENLKTPLEELTTKVLDSNPTTKSKEPPPLPYTEPDWSGIPEEEYKLEVLKSGTILDSIDLSKRSFTVFGRLENCDVSMAHPTVSRYHAILQYRAAKDEGKDPGFYIFDLGSSHGTFLNKVKLPPKLYIRVKVGHMLKFGCSTRMLILHGPPEDEEPESELSVTEMKQQYKEKLAAMEAEKVRLEEMEAQLAEENRRKEEERGIDWGMGEDADEETDLTENPYAQTQNEELYLEDPKKTLRGWFEREGEELVYDVEDKGFSHFICRIELPVDNGGGGNLVAEASVKGKKKEAVVQAALEACRLLDRQGLLRQTNQESKKKATKDWEANDFYDSDEDNFLDRTGHIEKKRQLRMAKSGKLEKTVETYDTLVEKYDDIVKELREMEEKMNRMLSLATQTDRDLEEVDELDAYMSSLKQTPADKIEIKRIKGEVMRLRLEEERMRKLVNIARPTELPKLEPPVIKPSTEKKVDLPQVKVGKMSSKKRGHKNVVLPQQTTQQITNDAEEEEDDEEESEQREDKAEKISTEEREVPKKKKSRKDTRNRAFKKQTDPMQMDEEDYNNLTWTPPVGQTGDGRTSLNDKLGY